MRRVYICAKLGGTPEEIVSNIDRAIEIGKRLWEEEGLVPVVPHTLALMLDDNDGEAREAGMNLSLALIPMCHELRYYDNPTVGMARETKRAAQLDKPVLDYRYMPGGCYYKAEEV